VSTFAAFSEQAEAKRLLGAALQEGPAHAYLFHGPHGVGKRLFARAFGRELLGTERQVHPDLYELEALGEMIRIDAIRERVRAA
jgi:DNA polymerase III subunit delta'